MRLLALLCSPHPSVKTRQVLEAVLDGAAAAGAAHDLVELSSADLPADLRTKMEAADAFVLASPTYRADVSWPMRALLDQTQRGFYGEESAPFQGKACATVVTGASDHHFLGSEKIRTVLGSFFALQVLSPGLYVQRAGFGDDGVLTAEVRQVAELHGRALVDLARAVRASEPMQALRPLV